jgi:acyl carrier protein
VRNLKADALLTAVMQRAVAQVQAETAFADIPGWDSIMMVRLMLQLEDIAGRELTELELESLVTVGDAERLMKQV